VDVEARERRGKRKIMNLAEKGERERRRRKEREREVKRRRGGERKKKWRG
jgi:hypothetical protein